MSRTDQHAPFLVRIARGDLDGYPEHDHRADICDLVPRDQVFTQWSRDSHCRWEFAFTGVFTCSCRLCHAGPARRADNRAARHRDRHLLHVALGCWSGGDNIAFDEVAAPSRSHWW